MAEGGISANPGRYATPRQRRRPASRTSQHAPEGADCLVDPSTRQTGLWHSAKRGYSPNHENPVKTDSAVTPLLFCPVHDFRPKSATVAGPTAEDMVSKASTEKSPGCWAFPWFDQTRSDICGLVASRSSLDAPRKNQSNERVPGSAGSQNQRYHHRSDRGSRLRDLSDARRRVTCQPDVAGLGRPRRRKRGPDAGVIVRPSLLRRMVEFMPRICRSGRRGPWRGA